MVRAALAGRQRERGILEAVVRSERAELIALYGRRRVGKTFLIRQHFSAQSARFLEVVGTKDGSAALQRMRFREALEKTFSSARELPAFNSWNDALSQLSKLIEQRVASAPNERIVLFFDELPWLATPRSGLLEALDYHWNARLSRVAQVTLILCGSAASWMLRRIVHAKGGLHNRLTRQIRLEPFTLAETKAYLDARRMRMKRREIIELYMALGGIPHYLSLIERGDSVAETVGRLCFERGGALTGEFEDVFASLFDNHEEHIILLKALATKNQGLTRNELIAAAGLSSGGGLNRRLQELEEAGFIARVAPYRAKVKNTLYRVIDEYSLFHLAWMQAAPRGILARGGSAYWQSQIQTPRYRAWSGYAFESICFKHALELQHALGIHTLVTKMGSWRHIPSKRSALRLGAQIDLIFERRDDIINLCEMKFSQEPFVVTKAYATQLKDKLSLFDKYANPNKRSVLTLVSASGLKRNSWSEDLIDKVVDEAALFAAIERP